MVSTASECGAKRSVTLRHESSCRLMVSTESGKAAYESAKVSRICRNWCDHNARGVLDYDESIN